MNDFIKKSKEIHGNKYDYSKVNYVNNHTNVCIICPKHGEFWQRPNNHLHGCGCPKCKSEKIGNLKRGNIYDFIEQAKVVHDDKYDYSKVDYVNNRIKVCIICPEHGDFYQSPNHHLQGHGCPMCKNVFKSNTEQFIKKSKEMHGNKYDYSKVDYINNKTKVCIICPKHGEFWQTPKNHLSGQGCNKCAIEYKNIKSRFTNDDFIKKSKEIHGNKYDYSKVNYINSATKVCIICPRHGEFWQTPMDNLQGCGCPKCGRIFSINENNINNFIKNNLSTNIITNSRDIIPPYELDIYIPDKKIAIEYNGVIWHSEKFGKNKNYHLTKTELCEKQGIRLIHIFEDEWLEHEDIVKSKLKEMLDINDNLPRINTKHCTIKEVEYSVTKDFLIKNHIQGACKSTVYIGCYYNDELVGAMDFRKETKVSNKWELTRFATDINKQCFDIIEKMFKYFVKKYKPIEIKSFVDRRWTLNKDNNQHTNLGFKLVKILKPDYKYVTKGKRISKSKFKKQILLKKYPNYGLTENMAEHEMAQKLGFYRIWDSGLYKYVWEK